LKLCELTILTRGTDTTRTHTTLTRGTDTTHIHTTLTRRTDTAIRGKLDRNSA